MMRLMLWVRAQDGREGGRKKKKIKMEWRAEVQLFADLHHAEGARRRGKTYFGRKQREGEPDSYLEE